MTASMCQSGSVSNHLRGASNLEITTVGVDLAKNLFKVHTVDERG